VERDEKKLLDDTAATIRTAMGGVTPTELARRLGKSSSDVAQLLRPTRNHTLVSLARLARALGMRVKVMFVRRR